MASFIKAFNKLIKAEGGYVNDPDDNGGETFMGVTRKNHPDCKMWKVIDEYKKKYNSTYGINKHLINNAEVMQQIHNIYKTKYWDKLMLDDVRSQNIANQIFDDSVNRGVNATVKLLSKLYGCSTKTMTLTLVQRINTGYNAYRCKK